jgi:hypothetical protein
MEPNPPTTNPPKPAYGQEPITSNPIPPVSTTNNQIVSEPTPTIIQQQPLAPNNLNQTSNQDFTIKILTPKYLFVILLAVLFYGIINTFVPSLGFLVIVLVLILAYITISKIKKNSGSESLESEKLKAIIFMTIDPLIVQAFYYYRLRKQNKQVAKTYNKLGWKILGIDFVFAAIIELAFVALHVKK